MGTLAIPPLLTVSIDGAPQPLPIVAGAGKVFTRQARDGLGNPFDYTNTPFLDTDTLACRVWGGDDTANVATPSVAWVSANSATFTITCAASDTSSLSGTYPYQVTCTRGGVTGVIDEAKIRVAAAPGSASAPLAFTVLDDLLRYFPTLPDLMPDSSQNAFAEEQARATNCLIDKLCRLWNNGTMPPAAGEPGFMGFTMGTLSGTSNFWLRSQLVPLVPNSTTPALYPNRQSTQANKFQPRVSTALLLYDEVLEIVAKWALSYVLRAQITRQSEQGWWKLANWMEASANNLFLGYVFGVDLSVPQTGYPSILISGNSTHIR